MEKDLPEIQGSQDLIGPKNFDIGTIVAPRSHPYYLGKIGQIKIGSYNHLTPPLMIVTECHRGKAKFDPETGIEISTSFKCLYYSTQDGKFEENWFRHEELKLIEGTPQSLCKDNKDTEFLKLKRELIGKQVILTTVDLELNKLLIYKNPDPENNGYKEKALLDFLPPIGSIISISEVNSYTTFSEKTGKPNVKKSRVLAKIRWFNNKTAKFSECEIPLPALKEVKSLGNTNYDGGRVYLYSAEMDLEDNNKFKLKRIPVRFYDIVFNHYKYEFRFRNVFTNELIKLGKEDLPDDEPIDLTNVLDSHKRNLLIIPEDAYKSKEFWEGKWFRIEYIDLKRNYSDRIIWVRKVVMNESPDSPKVLDIEANCLLRGGAIRNFHVDRILRLEELSGEFEAIFID